MLPNPFLSDAFEDDACVAVGGMHIYSFPFLYVCYHGKVPIHGTDMSEVGGWPQCEDLGGAFASTQDRCLTGGFEIYTAVISSLDAFSRPKTSSTKALPQ